MTIATTSAPVQPSAQSSLQLDLEQANKFLALLGKDPKQSWIRCLKPWRESSGTGADRRYPGVVPEANAYLITGNGNPANGWNLKDSDITSCPALFVEWDDTPVDWQISAWQEFGLPEPTVSLETGGKSIHHYWVLNEPMEPKAWRVLTRRLIDHTGADENNKNPSRLMRLPGSIYYDKETGEQIGQSKLIGGCERRYDAADIEACLPLPLPPKAAVSTRQLAATPNRQSSDGWPPRTVAEIEAAAAYIPARIVGGGTYQESMHAICGCSAAFAEAGVADADGAALELLGHLWADAAPGAAWQVLDSTSTREAKSYWAIAGDNGFPLSRKQSGTVREQSQNIPDSAAKPKPKAKKPKKQKLLSHTRAMECFNRCVYIQSIKERNSFRRRVRLLKAAKDLGLASYINRVELAAKILEAKQQTGDGGFKALTAADRAAMKKPVIHWLLPGLLPANDLTILGGRPKVGKTRLAVAMAAAVLKGEALFELPAPAKAAPVVLVTDDQSDGDTASMLEAVDLWDHPNLIWSRNFRISETDLDALLATIKANPGALVIIDSLRSISRSMQKGENDPEIGAVLYDLKQAVIDAGGTLLLIHHCNKAPDLVGVEALSGHNAIAGAANTVLTMHYLLGENNQPNKKAPERQLFREARSGDGLDLVITRHGNSFRSLGSMDAHKEQALEQKQLAKLNSLQHQVLEVVAGDWITRRQVCDELEIDWGDRGMSKEARQVKRALDRLTEIQKLEHTRDGLESTYRNPSRMGTKKDVSLVSVVSSSHTKGLSDTTFEIANGISGIKQSYQGICPAPASIDQKAENSDPMPLMPLIPLIPNKTDQPNTLLPLLDTTDTTDTIVFIENDLVAVKTSDGWQQGFTVTDVVDTSIGTRYAVERDDRRLNVGASELRVAAA